MNRLGHLVTPRCPLCGWEVLVGSLDEQQRAFLFHLEMLHDLSADEARILWDELRRKSVVPTSDD